MRKFIYSVIIILIYDLLAHIIAKFTGFNFFEVLVLLTVGLAARTAAEFIEKE